MADIYDWSTTPATNSSADSAINWAEGMDPDQVNDSARQMMARVAEVLKDVAPTRSSAGSSNAYTVTSAAVASGAYNDGEIVSFIVDRANTSSATLNVNSRGAVALRPEIGREFAAGELRANQPIMAFYRSASNEFLAVGSGYHVNAMTSGVLTQSVVGRLLKIGTPVLSLAPTAEAGYIRLTQVTQTLNKTDWPELNSWLSSISYPWGSTSTTFSLPPAAGYFLRFAATSSAIDTSGARTAGSTQTDQNKSHTHGASASSAVSDPTHAHLQTTSTAGFTGPATGGGYTAYAWAGSQLSGYAATGISVATSVTVNNTGSGGDEVRTKNVAMHVDVFASAALATGTLGQFGFSYAFDTATTSSDPGSGNVRLNNATLASATELYISETDGWGTEISGFLSTIANGVRLRLSKLGAQNNTVLFTASGAPTDNGTWQTIPGAVTIASGSFAAADTLAFEQFSGAAGATGATGAAGGGISYAWSTSTADSDPGAGTVKANNATLASVTEFYIDLVDSSGGTQTNVFDTWYAGSSSTNKGTLSVAKSSDPSIFATYILTAVTSATGYRKLTVTYLGGNGALSAADAVTVTFVAKGDTGAAGTNGTNGTDGSNGTNGTDPGLRWAFETSTTMAVPASGGVRLNNATLASVTELAINANCAETGNPSVLAFLQSLDDSTTASNKGLLVIKKASAAQNFAIYQINGELTDNTTWVQVPVTHVTSSGTLSAADVLSVQFFRAGDKGSDGAGVGTVTSIVAGAGLSGGTITSSGTIAISQTINAQSGTTYTVVSGDQAKLITFSNASAVVVTLPDAGGSFGSGWFADVHNKGPGAVTINRTTSSTIDGDTSVVVPAGNSLRLVSDNSNWQTFKGIGISGSTTTIASATTTDIGDADTDRVSITGTTTITSFGTVPNLIRFGSFTGALTLTHNATSLILPGGLSITTAAGDTFIASSDASGNWTVLSYQKASGFAVVAAPSIPQGRLTLTSATPVLTLTVSGATTVYYAPYNGRYVPLYGGSSFVMTDIGGELSQATTDTTKSPAACTTNSNYDLFVWSDGGTYRCTRGPAWSSATARGTGAGTTELESVNGIWVNKIAITNGPAAQRGTYVGTVRTNGSSQVDFILGGSASGGTAGVLNVWNMYNRVSVAANVKDSGTNYTYASTTIRQARASSGMQISYLIGLAEDSVLATYTVSAAAAAGSGQYTNGIGVDTITAYTAPLSTSNATGFAVPAPVTYPFMPSLGSHYVAALEASNVGTTTFYASGSSLLSLTARM